MANIVWKTKSELAMDQLRTMRNRKLQATDWWILKGNPTQAQLDYRQELRDITDSQTPILNENNDNGPTGVTWPTKPE
tara:strand:+ start:687 stop:920 length:234 start_codon:yes stop_codon:yes gene_type:complete